MTIEKSEIENLKFFEVFDMKDQINTEIAAGYKMTELGPLPQEWEVVRLGDLVKITSGGTPSRKIKEYYNGNNLWVKSGELEDNMILDSEEKITDEAIKNSSAKIFPEDTVLIAMYGATVGKTAILKKEATTNQAVCAILPNFKLFVPEFLRYYFIVKRDELLKQRYGGAQPNISQTIIKNTLVPKPPLPEQRKIAAILSTVQKAIEIEKTLIERTKELKKAMMHKLFTEGIPRQARNGARGERQKMTEIGPIPESWEVVRIGDTFKFSSGKSRPKNTVKNKTDKLNIPVYGGNGVLGYTNEILLNKTTLILGRVGEYCGCVHLTEEKCWISDNALYVKEQYKDVDLYFIKNLFEWLNLNKYSNKMGQPLITQGIINDVLFGLPSVKEQNDIADHLIACDNKINFHQKKEQLLQDLFKTLLYELLTARVRVNKINLDFLNEKKGEIYDNT